MSSLQDFLNTRKQIVSKEPVKPTKEEIEFGKLPLYLQKQALEYIRKWIKGVSE